MHGGVNRANVIIPACGEQEWTLVHARVSRIFSIVALVMSVGTGATVPADLEDIPKA